MECLFYFNYKAENDNIDKLNCALMYIIIHYQYTLHLIGFGAKSHSNLKHVICLAAEPAREVEFPSDIAQWFPFNDK